MNEDAEILEPTKEIAIIEGHENYDEDGYYSRYIVTSITNWDVVDLDTYNKLKQAGRVYGFTVITRMPLEQGLEKVEDYVKKIERERKKEEQAKLKREEAARERKLRKAASNEQKQRDLYEQLKEKFGE